MTSTDPILVAGVNRPLGAYIALDLAGRGLKVVGTRRHPDVDLDARMQAAGIELAPLDLTDLTAISALAPQLSRVVLTPILSISGPAAHAFHAGGGLRRF